MNVRIKAAPGGLYNGADWPAVGEQIDLPDHVAAGMIRTGHVEAVAAPPAPVVETRPAPVAAVQTRPGLVSRTGGRSGGA